MSQPTGLLQISRADDHFACDLLDRGEPREVVYKKLVERGIPQEAAAEQPVPLDRGSITRQQIAMAHLRPRGVNYSVRHHGRKAK